MRVGWCDVCTDFTNVIKVDDVNNSDGKARLKRQKSPETTTDTRDMSKFYCFYEKSLHISKYLSLLVGHISFPILFLITF